jgi:hypothetical protein
MPAPQASMMKQLARAKFSSFAIRVPTDWQQPQGTPGQQYPDAFQSSERSAPPDSGTLFQPASSNKFHVDTQKKLNEQFGEFIDGICSAICSAWSTWQSTATIVGVMITGPVASVGSCVGAPWTPLILASAPKSTPMQLKYSTTIASVIGTAWLQFTSTIKIPGLPWYPSFAACPMPVAPPMPNTPAPFSALVSVDAGLQVSALKGQMVGQNGDPNAPFAAELFESVSDGFNKCFTQWKTSTMINNVLGTGPVPTYAPPYVPAGPVMGGVGTMTPGGFT